MPHHHANGRGASRESQPNRGLPAVLENEARSRHVARHSLRSVLAAVAAREHISILAWGVLTEGWYRYGDSNPGPVAENHVS